jgi:hypothetical protein
MRIRRVDWSVPCADGSPLTEARVRWQRRCGGRSATGNVCGWLERVQSVRNRGRRGEGNASLRYAGSKLGRLSCSEHLMGRGDSLRECGAMAPWRELDIRSSTIKHFLSGVLKGKASSKWLLRAVLRAVPQSSIRMFFRLPTFPALDENRRRAGGGWEPGNCISCMFARVESRTDEVPAELAQNEPRTVFY